MTPSSPQAPAARWRRVKEVFDRAIELPSGEVTRFIDEACGSDSSLRDEVVSLLGAHIGAGEFMEKAVVDISTPRNSVGRQIGVYHLESLVGQGGMGEVYLSTREVEGYPMRVALKLIRHSAITPGALRRFRMERQILARLHHPGITSLLDGGVTEDGVPYLVTEFVEGTPLDKSAAARTYSLTRRLEMFIAICDAVTFAHRHLVVHGDLKPGNILHCDDGGIKLLDFGISRLMLQSADDTTEEKPGATTQPAMTPAWASPEQLRGEPAGIASDIYSLGRILYFLLTWEPAFPIERLAPMQYYEKLQNHAPQAPSARTSDRRMEGDLDNIALKALEFDAAERYPSVEALAEDIRAHLTSRPISARPHTWTYRSSKFIRRNKAVVVGTVAVVMALSIGLGMTLWQARIARLNYERAERRFQDVRRLANSFIFDMDDAIARLPGSTSIRGTMVRNALQYLDSLVQEGKDDPILQEELATAYEKIGDIQGRPGALNLGETAASLNSYRKAQHIRRGLLEQAKDEISRDRYESSLARTLMRVSSILRATGDLQAALDADRLALEMRRALLDRKPDSTSRLRDVASSLTATSASLTLIGGFPGALELRQEGLVLYERLVKANPGNEEDLQGLALAHTRMASILIHEKDYAGGVKHHRASLEIHQKLGRSHPGQTPYEMALALAHSNLGNALRINSEPKQGLSELRVAERIYQAQVNADPNEVRARTLLATVRFREARIAIELNRPAEAQRILRGVLEERRLLAERNPANAGARGEVAETLAGLGDAAAKAKDFDRAVMRYNEALEIFSALKKEGRFSAANKEEVERIEGRLEEVRKPAR